MLRKRTVISMRIGIKMVLVAVLAATLEQLSMASMIQQSTSIVRARVTAGSAARHGAGIYTSYRLDVLETLKGKAPAEVAVPGGSLNDSQQTVSGAPVLVAGQEYVLFLWTSRSGLTQVIGLTQGVFTVGKSAQGAATLSRPAATEPMLGADGRPVTDQGVNLTLESLRKMTSGGLK